MQLWRSLEFTHVIFPRLSFLNNFFDSVKCNLYCFSQTHQVLWLQESDLEVWCSSQFSVPWERETEWSLSWDGGLHQAKSVDNANALVKNWGWSEILADCSAGCLQANGIACCSFTDVGRNFCFRDKDISCIWHRKHYELWVCESSSCTPGSLGVPWSEPNGRR